MKHARELRAPGLVLANWCVSCKEMEAFAFGYQDAERFLKTLSRATAT